MHYARLPLFFLMLLAAACKNKDSVTITPPEEYLTYSKLDSGSYWIYGYYLRDSLGNGTATGAVDSCYVEKGTLLRGATWAKYIDPALPNGFTLMRDSLQFIVDYSGNILFESGNKGNVFATKYVTDPGHQLSAADTFARVITVDAGQRFNTAVPAGTFGTNATVRSWTVTLPAPGVQNPRKLFTHYAHNAGKVSEDMDFMANDPFIRQRRLLRFQVRPTPVF